MSNVNTVGITDVIVVGSGPGGVCAALGLTKHDVQVEIFDGGIEPQRHSPVGENLYDFTDSNDGFELLIGDELQGLRYLNTRKNYLPPRLLTPHFSFVSEKAQDFLPIESDGYAAVQSLAKGGLANAWGAGCYRYTNADLQSYPVGLSELNHYYDALTPEVGVSGTLDDLRDDFGADAHLLPPLELSINARQVLAQYQRQKNKFVKRQIRLGHARLAILSQPHNGRAAHQYENLEFWQPRLPSIYTPAFTLEHLLQQKKIEYRPGVIVQSFERLGDRIVVHGIECSTQKHFQRECRNLILAAGAINSARIVLQSNNDYATRLPLLDNPALQIPFVLPNRIGTALDRRALGSVQLNMIFKDIGEEILQSSLIDLTSPSRAEFFGRFPLSAKANLALIRHLLPAMMVNMVFFPSSMQTPAFMQLKNSGQLEIKGPPGGYHFAKETIKKLIGATRLLGGLTHEALIVRVPPGGGVHYAGSLPMTASNASGSRYACTKDGELFAQRGVFVADGAALPCLAAKNHTFTLMANAMRIGEIVAKHIRE